MAMGAQTTTTRSRILGMGHYVPDEVVTSGDLESELDLVRRLGVPKGFLERTTGVAERRWAAPGTTNSELAANAARVAIENAGVSVRDIDCIIFAACGQDIAEPATANIVQERLGAHNAQVFDVKNACNSWVSALDIMDSLVATGKVKCGLVTSGEYISYFVDKAIETPEDLNTKLSGLTLGDAGAAAVIGPSDGHRGILKTVFQSDGREWPLAVIKTGGSMFGWDKPKFHSTSARLLAVAARELPPVIWRASRELGWKPRDVDVIVPHQVSNSFARKMCMLMGVPIERCILTLEKFGNCGAASVPLALSYGVHEGRVKDGDRVALLAAAAGFSAGVVGMVW